MYLHMNHYTLKYFCRITGIIKEATFKLNLNDVERWKEATKPTRVISSNETECLCASRLTDLPIR